MATAHGRPRIEPDRVTESFAIGNWKRLTLWVVDGHTPVDELESLRQLSQEWREATTEKVVSLIVLHGRRTTMSGPERRSVMNMINETKHTRLASATVVLGRGLIGSAHRSILTGMSIIVPSPHPVKICAEVSEAIDFLHPYIETVCGPVRHNHIELMCHDLHGAVCARKLLAEQARRRNETSYEG